MKTDDKKEKPAPRYSPTIAFVGLADRIELIARRALDNGPKARAALSWYRDAQAWIGEVAGRLDIPQNRLAGFVAAMSPQNGWDDQRRYTEAGAAAAIAILETRESSRDTETVERAARTIVGPGFDSNKRKATRILTGEDPLAVLSGPKVRAFYRNLTGDTQAVTIDRHATVIAWGENAPLSLTAKRYVEASAAYVEAGSRLGLAPSAIQALTWCAHRDTLNGAPW